MSTFITAPYVGQLRNEYSENLLSYESTFNNDLTFNITSGVGSVTQVTNIYFEGFKCLKIESLEDSLLTFQSSEDLGFTCQNDGNYIFSFRVYCPNFLGDEPNFNINIFKNGLFYKTIQAFYTDVNILNNWLCFAQTLNFNNGDVITFSMSYQSGLTESQIIYVDGLKCEFDNLNLGIPTAWSVPIEYNPLTNNIIFVNSLADLPTAVAGVITLEDDKTYYITSNIDLLGNRLVGGSNTTIIGTSSEVSILTSTGLGVGIPLLTSIYTTPIRNISINDIDTAVSFDGTSNPSEMALDWTGVNFVNVPNVGAIKKASNFIFDKGAFLNSKGLKFDGTIGTVALNNSLFSGDGLAGNILELLSTCEITRRFRVIYSSIIATSSTIGVNVSNSALIPVESYILDTVNFSGGGTYLSGVSVTDNQTLFVNCKGIANSNEVSQYYMNGNATTTTVSATNVPYKVLGTTNSASITQKFTNTNNRATYIGSLTRQFLVTATLSLESGTNNQIGCYIGKNGSVSVESEVYGTTSGTGRAENITIQTLLELSTNDYIEIFVENATAINNILVTDLNVIVK